MILLTRKTFLAMNLTAKVMKIIATSLVRTRVKKWPAAKGLRDQ